jgi:hypothetical protein
MKETYIDIVELMFEELNLNIDLLNKEKYKKLYEFEIIKDSKGFYIVDYEEGDYGCIKFLDKNTNKILAIYIDNGGDDSYYEFSKEMIEIAKPILKDAFNEELNKKLNYIEMRI